MSEIDFSVLKGKTVLMTGGAGFIGSHLTERLLELGASVICADNFSTGSEINIQSFLSHPQYTLMRTDVNLFEEIARVFALKRIDYVFHAAAVVGVKNVIERPLDVFKDLEGIKYLLALALAHRVKKVVFASSSEAYGEPTRLPESEDGHLNVDVNDPYGLTKLVGENMMHNYWKFYGLPTTSLRFFNIYGPRQISTAYGFVAGIFMEKALRGEPFIIFGDGTQTRDFIFVTDNVELELRALLSDAANGETINVGSGRQTTVLELAERVARLAGVEPKFNFQPKRSMEIKYRCPEITKMKRLLGYEPKVSLDEGLAQTFEWYKRRSVTA